MIKNYSIKEQKQNELQWWGEQRIASLHARDDKYRAQCEITIDRLTKEIRELDD